MFPALDMELEIVRTVAHNDINDIYVCKDLKKNTGVFYTMVSIRNTKFRKLIAEKLNTERLFFSNNDFVGSFIYESCLNLVFRYYQESLLSLLGGVYLVEFAECKRCALQLAAAYAQSGADAELGMLILQDRNINITKAGEIYFNYFLDFSKFQSVGTENNDMKLLAEKIFEILELNYKGKYETPNQYPDELRLFYLRMSNIGFMSIGHMIASVRVIPDQLAETKGVIPWLKRNFRKVKNYLFQNSTATFLTILIIVTLIYAANQIYNRWLINRAYERNISYYGIETIGDVYLGNEE